MRSSAFVSKLERYTRLYSGIGTIQAFSERREGREPSRKGNLCKKWDDICYQTKVKPVAALSRKQN